MESIKRETEFLKSILDSANDEKILLSISIIFELCGIFKIKSDCITYIISYAKNSKTPLKGDEYLKNLVSEFQKNLEANDEPYEVAIISGKKYLAVKTGNRTGHKISLYDGKGYVMLYDLSPSLIELGKDIICYPAQCARVCTNTDSKSKEDDHKLTNYLIKHAHTSPLEFVKFTFKMKIPLFVARQLLRHRTARVNEKSFRYVAAEPDDYYLPPLRKKGTTNRQSSSSVDNIKEAYGEDIDNLIEKRAKIIQELYNLNGELTKRGVANEVVRAANIQGHMTELLFDIDLNNFYKFLKLRTGKDAQYEIQELASAMQTLTDPFLRI